MRIQTGKSTWIEVERINKNEVIIWKGVTTKRYDGRVKGIKVPADVLDQLISALEAERDA